MRVSEFKFTFEGQDYLLRSAYCPSNPKSCNQLICKSFVANDLNQDRIIDEVINSDIPISKVQKVYDYCLDALEKQGKINQIDYGNNIFTFTQDNYTFEIKTFTLATTNPFNQFTIRQHKGFYNSMVTVFVDKNADGTLDETLKGDFNISDAQKKYSNAIERGLQLNKLKKENDFIFCR
jgi:hypothetical protein